MKRVALRTFNVPFPGQDEPITFDYAELLIGILSGPRREGFSVDEIRQRIPVMDKLGKAQKNGADHILLEDAQHKMLAQAVKANRFGYVSAAILQLVDEVEGAPDVEVEVKGED